MLVSKLDIFFLFVQHFCGNHIPLRKLNKVICLIGFYSLTVKTRWYKQKRNVLHRNCYLIFWRPKTIKSHLQAVFTQRSLIARGDFKVLMSFLKKSVTCWCDNVWIVFYSSSVEADNLSTDQCFCDNIPDRRPSCKRDGDKFPLKYITNSISTNVQLQIKMINWNHISFYVRGWLKKSRDLPKSIISHPHYSFQQT